ncbi:unnamed protein product [Camellia sinensis]
MEDLSALLCSEAIHIEGKLKHSSDLTVAYATVTDSHAASNISRGFNSYHQNRGSSRGDSRGAHRGTRFYSGRSSRGRSQGRGQFGIVCQICGKANHIALDCWHRLDTQFQSSQMSPSQQSKPYQSQQSKAYVTSLTEDNGSCSPWFLDSAASDHITNDLHQLNSIQPYTAGNQVTIGNGSSLPITHTGQGQAFQGHPP